MRRTPGHRSNSRVKAASSAAALIGHSNLMVTAPRRSSSSMPRSSECMCVAEREAAPSATRGVISQVEGYAASVVADERFRNVDVQWEFWAISDDLGPVGKFRVGDKGGAIMRQRNVAVFLKTWGQVIDENRARLQFYQEKLEYQANKESALKQLQEHYAKYLDGVLEESPEANVTAEVGGDAEPETSAA